MLRAASLGSVPRLLAASAVASPVTGTANETALATVSVPAGAMGLNGGVHIYTTWSATNSANAKTLRVRFGGAAGTQYALIVVTASPQVADFRRIRNRNSASSQVGSLSNNASSFGVASGAIVTSSVDTSVAVEIVISGQLTLNTETITLESYEVWLVP